MTDVDIRSYSPTMRRLVRALGIDGAMRLLRWRGGRRMCIPREVGRTTLTQHMHVDEVQAMIDTFGGGMWITLPKPDQLHLSIRNRQIRADHRAGASLAELAALYGLTSRHIINIVGEDVDAANEVRSDAQKRLFG